MSYLRDIKIIVNAKVPMRDGVELATSVYLPVQGERFPVVLVRTPYGRMGIGAREYTSRGLAVVAQDCRGRHGSDGHFFPWIDDRNDGLDTLDWLLSQPWCNGSVGMEGDSYLAMVQWLIARENHPAIKALTPRFVGDSCGRGFYDDGAFSLALSFSWASLEIAGRVSEYSVLPKYDVGALLRELPLSTLDEKAGCGVVPAYRDMISHERDGEYWESRCFRTNLSNATAPILQIGGWYDYYAAEVFRRYAELCSRPADAETIAGHRILIGPWTHGVGQIAQQLGELDFGPQALTENDATANWLECLLKGGKPADYATAPIRIFVMGANCWRDEYEWPLARTRFTPFYLRLPDDAGEDSLSPTPPGAEVPDQYLYDPMDPTPTLGGNHSVGSYNPGLYEICRPGPFDQRPVEQRADVLVYTSSVLDEDVEVTGPVTMTLYASSSAIDTDFIARLCDVYPDGRSINVTEGVLRARFRARDWDLEEPLQPGEVYEFHIDLQVTSQVFFKGHRLRIDIASSSFPLLDRNLNLGEPLATATNHVCAEQTIYHDATYPSHVVLPIVSG